MADFAHWVAAAEAALPWEDGTFLQAYKRNRRDAVMIVLDHEPLAERLIEFAREEEEWKGTASLLHAALVPLYDEFAAFPRTPGQLSKRLRRIAPALREAGVELRWARSTDRARTRLVTVTYNGQ